MILSVTYTLWIPDGVKTFRGIIVPNCPKSRALIRSG
jgi:hypothetical protein